MVVPLIALASLVALVVGTLLHLVVLVWTALGLSVAGLGFVTVRSVLRGRAARRSAAASDTDTPDSGERMSTVDIPAPETGDHSEAGDTAAVSGTAVSGDADEQAAGSGVRPGAVLVAERTGQIVRVVAGRRRFHVGDCGLLGERRYEEITRDEAVDEGFTACTTCCG